MLRSGNDESTMGPFLILSDNKINNSYTEATKALIHLYGTQRSVISNNEFSSCNKGHSLMLFEDIVRARHQVQNNTINQSGKIVENEFVKLKYNSIR